MNNEKTFRTNKRTSLFRIITVRFYGIAPFIVAIYAINIIDFGNINKIVFSAIIGLMIIYNIFYRKKYRNVLQVQINSGKQEVYLQYCQYVIIHTICIPYSQLNYTYAKELYGYTSTPLTLVLYKNNIFIAQIMDKYSGWSDENIKILNDYRIYDLKCLPLWEQIIKGHEFTKFRITIS